MKDLLNTFRQITLTACGGAALLYSLPTQAEDSSIKRRLDSVGQKYEIDKDGDFKITLSFTEDKRSQIVFVQGAPYDVGGVQVRNIFAPVAKVAEDNVADKAVDLLKANNGYKIGAYEIEGSILMLSLKIPEAATGEQLQKAIRLAATVADNKEIELSGTRDTF
jgi:hypothetical protein